jgi:20S proteasome subunit alpha 2
MRKLSSKNGELILPLSLLCLQLTRPFSVDRYNDDLSLEDAIHTALLTLKEGFEGVMDEKTIELGIISTQPSDETFNTLGHGTGLKGSPGFRKLTEQEVAE